jgi:hypothetical protein
MEITKQGLREYLEANPEKLHTQVEPFDCVVSNYLYDTTGHHWSSSGANLFGPDGQERAADWLRTFTYAFDELDALGANGARAIPSWEVLVRLGDHLKDEEPS